MQAAKRESVVQSAAGMGKRFKRSGLGRAGG